MNLKETLKDENENTLEKPLNYHNTVLTHAQSAANFNDWTLSVQSDLSVYLHTSKSNQKAKFDKFSRILTNFGIFWLILTHIWIV